MMDFFGLTEEDYIEENKAKVVEVCSDNWRACEFFMALGMGSWNMGFGGPTGLRPESFAEIRYTLGVTRKEWPELFAQIRVMEEAALEEINREDA